MNDKKAASALPVEAGVDIRVFEAAAIAGL